MGTARLCVVTQVAGCDCAKVVRVNTLWCRFQRCTIATRHCNVLLNCGEIADYYFWPCRRFPSFGVCFAVRRTQRMAALPTVHFW
jgi:hypothetical protein